MSTAIYKRACAFCKTINEKLKICGNCNSTHYCGIECQKKDWKNHKKLCKKSSEYKDFIPKIDEISRHVASISEIFDLIRVSIIVAGTFRVAVICLVDVRENGTFITEYGADTVITNEKIDELCRTGTVIVRDTTISIDNNPGELEHFRQSLDSMFAMKSIPVIIRSQFSNGKTYMKILTVRTET